MSLVRRHVLVRVRPVMVDDGRGNQEPTWPDEPDELRIPGWGLDSSTTTEDIVNRDGDEIAYVARGPFDADVRRDDRIRLELDGNDYRIDGGVSRQPGPTPATSHTVLVLKRWEG